MNTDTKTDQTIALNDEQTDYVFLLYVYMICADGQEHIKETKALDKIAEKNEVNEKMKDEALKILSQDELCLPLNKVVEAIPEKLHDECMQYLAALAYVDGYCDPLEREFLESVAKKWNISELDLNSFCADGEIVCNDLVGDDEALDFSNSLSLGEKIVCYADKLCSGNLLKGMKSLQSNSVKQIVNKLEGKILLSGSDYDEAIKKCQNISQEDIFIVMPALKSTRNSLKELKKNLEETIIDLERVNNRVEAKTARDVVDFLRKTEEQFANEIFMQLEAINSSLHKKERAMQYFTISFIGKTKVGKSTLHAVVTGQGKDAIGAGKQRTTRLNRVYEWKNIRIIDTPGIGAPGGKTDEEIAKSIIDESDIICFVFNNNNQQETEFAVLEQLKKKAKPLLILLNVKENLDHPRKLERFLQNPDKIFSLKDKSALGGHFDRIQRYAEQNYGNAYFEIIPVQLYAALLGQQSKDKKDKSDLLEASRLQYFLDSLKIGLIRDGSIRRSQTLLGCTVGELDPIVSWTALKIKELNEVKFSICSHRESGLKKIVSFGEQVQEDLKREFGKVFSELRGSIDLFADNNWTKKESELKKLWKEHIDKRKALLESSFEKITNSYSNDVLDLLEEIGSEMSLMAKINFPEDNLKEQGSNAFMKNFLKIGGSFLGVAGSGAFAYAAFATGASNFWNPFGWVLMGVGVAMGLGSMFFKSKVAKQKNAVKNITKALRQLVDEQKKSILSNVLKDSKKFTNNVEKSITTYFSIMEDGLSSFVSSIQVCNDDLLNIQRKLNFAYGKRVVDWVQDEQKPLTEDAIQSSIESVDRIVGEEIIIKTFDKIKIKKDLTVVQSVLQENLTIKGV
jgi:GTP-binding protein EngB required for normal cell division